MRHIMRLSCGVFPEESRSQNQAVWRPTRVGDNEKSESELWNTYLIAQSLRKPRAVERDRGGQT